MSDIPVEILKLLSVTLTREKQDVLIPELHTYVAATNYAIKTIFKKRIPSKKKAHDLLRDEIAERFVFSAKDGQPGSSESFGQRFKYSTIMKYVPERVKVKTEHGLREIQYKPEELRQKFSWILADQYVNDVLKTAAVEVTGYRKLIKNVVSMRGKIPHFKAYQMIVSGLLVDVGEKAVNLLTLSGETLSIPFDKRSRNRVIETLRNIAEKKRKFDRVRLTWNKEGFLNLDIRLPKN
ncbi:MAG: hypothetical protein KAQ65_10045 [Candidatus Thorarchaeota archaeon]|nr:hypothetical protein [Candidatus Thorarchaeota archaeon]